MPPPVASTGHSTPTRRSARRIVVGPVKGKGAARYAAYFGDKKANVYAVDARTGTLLWKVNPEPRLLEHVTGGAALYEGRVFVGLAGSEEITSLDPHYPCCTYRGSLSAIDANTGKIIWKTYTIAEAPKPIKKNSLGTQLWGPAGASIWTTPTVDPERHAVYVGTGNSFAEPVAKNSDAIVAFDIKTGKILWSYQALANDVSPAGCNGPGPRGEQCPPDPGPDWDFGNSPILRTLPGGHRVLVAADKGGLVVAVDPDRKGALLWKTDLAEPNAARRSKSCGAVQQTLKMSTTRSNRAASRQCVSRTESASGPRESIRRSSRRKQGSARDAVSRPPSP